MNQHESYMQRCLQLATNGAGTVAPNPMVGAVLVYNDRIIGEGWHKQYGDAHAELNCINSVKEKDRAFISQSVLYVSLEPCAHFGKTPPCADLIIRNNIPQVVIGCRDPFEQVNGKGIEKLQAASVNVVQNILENECKAINKRFFIFHTQQRPYLILKWAQTADQKIAAHDDQRLMISNEYSNRLVHQWRSEEAAILIGTTTALKDDPLLTTRLWPGKSPVRLLLDIDLKLPHSLQVFNKQVRTIVFNTVKNEQEGKLEFYKIKGEDVITEMLSALYHLKIQSVIVEGGARLLQSFIDKGIWDEARIIENEEMKTGNGLAAPVLADAVLLSQQKLGSDRIRIYNHK